MLAVRIYGRVYGFRDVSVFDHTSLLDYCTAFARLIAFPNKCEMYIFNLYSCCFFAIVGLMSINRQQPRPMVIPHRHRSGAGHIGNVMKLENLK